MPIYPAAMSSLPEPMMVPGRWQTTRITAAVLCFVALVMVVAGTFLPLWSGELSFGPPDSGFGDDFSVEVTVTPWHAEYSRADLNDSPGDVPKLGYPMVFAAVIIAGAALTCGYAAMPAASRTSGRAAGVVTAVSAAFLIGTVWTTAVVVTNGVDYINLLGAFGNGIETDATYLAGYWLLLISTLLCFAAAVLALLPVRQPVWQPPPPVNPFVATPPYGISLPLGARQAAPVVHPTYIDPVTGEAHTAPPVDPVTGQPSPPSGVPIAVDPLTGEPLPAAGPVTVDPLTGQPIGPVSPPTGTPAQPVPFTPEPVGPVNGAIPQQQATEPPPIVIPDAPPQPETPPGPAIPPTEDPLAEPPRTS